MATHFCVLPVESHGQRNLVGYSPYGYKESDTTEVTEHACMHALPLYAQECFNLFDGITQWVHSHDYSFGFVTK